MSDLVNRGIVFNGTLQFRIGLLNKHFRQGCFVCIELTIIHFEFKKSHVKVLCFSIALNLEINVLIINLKHFELKILKKKRLS